MGTPPAFLNIRQRANWRELEGQGEGARGESRDFSPVPPPRIVAADKRKAGLSSDPVLIQVSRKTGALGLCLGDLLSQAPTCWSRRGVRFNVAEGLRSSSRCLCTVFINTVRLV